MKKILMTMAAMAVSVCASAQVYIGGTVGFGGIKQGGGDSKTFYKFVPEIGYQFNKNWEAGLTVGYQGVEDGNNMFTVAPYARYNFVTTKLVDLFIEGTVGYGHVGGHGADADAFEIGLKPGLKVNLSNHISFITKVGFLGWQKNDVTDVQKWGLDVDATNVQFGVNYKF